MQEITQSLSVVEHFGSLFTPSQVAEIIREPGEDVSRLQLSTALFYSGDLFVSAPPKVTG